YPLGVTLVESVRDTEGLTLSRYISLLDPSNSGNWEAVLNSVGVSLFTVLLSGAVGLLFAVVFTQMDFPFRSVLGRLAIVPIALPPLVGVIAFLLVFGESGILPRLMKTALGLQVVPFYLDGLSAILAVHVYSFYVYSYLLCASALRQIDGSVLEAAANLGGGAWTTFRRIVLPDLRPALLGGALLTFMASMASFSAPLIFAGSHRFLTLQIYSTKLNGDLNLAAAQSLMLTLFSISFFVMLSVILGRRLGTKRTRGVSKARRIPISRPAGLILVGGALVLLVLERLPLMTIGVISFAREGSWTYQLLPQKYTFDNYLALLTDASVFEPVQNSLGMAGLTLVVILVVGVGAAYLITKGGLGRSRLLVDTVLTLPYAIPGTVVAISLILAFNTPSIITGNAVLVGTFWLLPLAYVLRTYPLVVRSTAAAFDQVEDSLLEAGRSSGAGPWRIFRKIVLPLVLPGIVSGSLLAMIAALGEFVSSILLYAYPSRPISVEILSQLRSLHFGSAAAYCVILLIIILFLIWLSNALLSRSRRSLSF
ncbi:MAG: iron ABC transporter permease, partial [Bacteroidota bacterium]